MFENFKPESLETRIKLFVPGKPVPQKRHRSARRIIGGCFKQFQIDDSKSAKQAFVTQARRWAPREPWIEPISATLLFAFPIPKSRKDLTGGDPHPVKPDSDNLEKFVWDAFNGVFFKDDSQVYKLEKSKIYTIDKYVGVWIILNR